MVKEIRFFDPQCWLPPEQVHCQFSRLLVPHHWSFLRRFQKNSLRKRTSCVCASMRYTSSRERGGPRTVPKALELELQVDVSLLVWVQGTPVPPSGRAGSPLNCRAIFPAQKAFACLYLSCFQQESFILNRNSPRGLDSLLLMP